MKVLVIGDIVGKGGRQAVKTLAGQLRHELVCCFCIANGENCAGGAGLSADAVLELKTHGVDVITTGDHVWDRQEFQAEIKHLPCALRPANVCAQQPGQGCGVFPVPIGGSIAVINLVGRVFMRPEADCPFAAADRLLAEVAGRTRVIFVDFHAEATSEKIAMGRYLDGRVTAVFGTHTHVPTADERILPKGTAYISDIGMVGAADSVLGRNIDAVLHRFVTGMPARFKVVDEGIVLQGAVIEFDPETGHAKSIQRVTRAAP